MLSIFTDQFQVLQELLIWSGATWITSCVYFESIMKESSNLHHAGSAPVENYSVAACLTGGLQLLLFI